MKLARFLFLILFVFISHYMFCQIPAFPGAEGFGSTTFGGRGGKVIKVTNLNDHGPGSLRFALNEEGPRIVIFETGGIINLETKLEINNPFITIAGQTAPGDGICLRGEGLAIHTHDVVMRYFRIRPGDIDFGPENAWSGIDALAIDNKNIDSLKVFNIVIDHCSFSWAIDENVSIWYNAHDITIQNCIISQGLKSSKHPKGDHSMGLLIGPDTKNISLHNNLFAHNSARNPVLQGEGVYDFRNNIIYDPQWQASAIYYGNGSITKQEINLVSNYYIKGPHSNTDSPLIVRGKSNDVAKIYLKGNIGFNNDSLKITSFSPSERIAYNIFSDNPFPAPFVTTEISLNGILKILNHVGASRVKRDNIDETLIDNVKLNKGFYANSKDDPFEWPPYSEGFITIDSDGDGMPDHWEKENHLNYNRKDDTLDSDKDGYTNIEEYINNTDPHDTTNIFFLNSSIESRLNNGDSNSTLKIFPNPFVNDLSFHLSISSASHTNIILYDSNGRLLKKVVNDFLYKGEYKLIWTAEIFAPGVYYLKFTTNSTNSHFKLLKRSNF